MSVIEVRDEVTGELHLIHVEPDPYGVSLYHEKSGCRVILEIFNGMLQALCYDTTSEEPINVCKFEQVAPTCKDGYHELPQV